MNDNKLSEFRTRNTEHTNWCRIPYVSSKTHDLRRVGICVIRLPGLYPYYYNLLSNDKRLLFKKKFTTRYNYHNIIPTVRPRPIFLFYTKLIFIFP